MAWQNIDDILLKEQEEADKAGLLDGNGNGHAENDKQEEELESLEEVKEETTEEEDQDQKLAKEKLTKDDIEFMFQTMMKEAKHDGISIKQLFYGMMSREQVNP